LADGYGWLWNGHWLRLWWRNRRRRGDNNNRLRLRILLGELALAVRNMLLGVRLVRIAQLYADPQIFLKAKDRFRVTTVLLQTAALVIDVSRVLGIEKQIGKNRYACGVVAAQASFPSRALFRGLMTTRKGGLCGGYDNDRDAKSNGAAAAFSRRTHGG
jgi:hypothetical protein